MHRKLLSGILTLTTLTAGLAFAADHRDAPTANADPAGDINDVYVFLDPKDPSRLVLAMTVFPFAVSSSTGYAFSKDILYQLKIDNDGDAKEDFVLQLVCSGVGTGQTCKVYGPVKPNSVGVRNSIVAGSPAISGGLNVVLGDAAGIQSFAGLREDAFAFDLGQFNRIITSGTADTFREVDIAPLGITLRGRKPDATGKSGFDTFAGFNTLAWVVSFPKSLVRGAGSKINAWGTTSRQAPEEISQNVPADNRTFVQFDRMGQAAFNTVFIPPDQKDLFNAGAPADDFAFAWRWVPNALTSDDTTGNTIAGRITVLTLLGLGSPGKGAPLILPPTFVNTNKDLLRVALLPDVIRLDLDLAPGDLAIGQFGLLNGRRPGDDVIDILLQLSRQLADVTFPAALGVPGSGELRPGSLDFPGDRRVFAVLQGTDFIKPDAALLSFGDSGNDKTFLAAFPFLAPPHPFPGEGSDSGN